MFILMIDNTEDYEPADIHGPFDSVDEAKVYAERWRERNALPGPATPENNETWTDAGWYFGIFPLKKDWGKVT